MPAAGLTPSLQEAVQTGDADVGATVLDLGGYVAGALKQDRGSG